MTEGGKRGISGEVTGKTAGEASAAWSDTLAALLLLAGASE
ncbi:MAG: hypothetical protein SWH61_01680 [Thermodesulfobacteriota bacterium]|nr:hypothetical protein [Thermodesulfobacteriota bacterium]